MRDAAYTLVRRDSLTLQLPGGASQLQLIDRTAYLHLTLAQDTSGYLATIVLDSRPRSASVICAGVNA